MLYLILSLKNCFREYHIQPDWLLIYLLENDILTLTLVDTMQIYLICNNPKIIQE